jgi:peptidyl-prolyl cis-trans isomerase D
MMKTMRENAKVILWIVLSAFMITIVAVWGAKSIFLDSKANPDVIAKVGKNEITYTVLGEAWNSKLQQLSDQGIKVSEDKSKEIKKEILNALIDRSLQLEYAKKLGISATDEEAAQSIASIQAFNDKGVFQKERYIAYLNSQRISVDDFENEQKDTIVLTKLRNMFYAGIKITSDELRTYYMKRGRRVAAQYVCFNYKNFLNELKIDDEKMKDYYAVNKKNYEKPDRVRASHILIRPDASPTSPTGRTDDAAKKFAESLLARIKSGESFEALAKKYSQDPGSGAKGGDLDYFARGQMVPEFESAAFSMKTGEVSGIVKTQFGYHIIKVTGKEAGFDPTFDKVKSKVLSEMQKDEGVKLMKEKAQALKDSIKDPSDFDKLYPSYHVALESVSFSEGSKPAGISSPDFTDTMLDMNRGDISQPIQGDNGYYIARISSESPAVYSEADFNKKYDTLETKLKSIKFTQEHQDMLDRLKAEQKVEIFEKNL